MAILLSIALYLGLHAFASGSPAVPPSKSEGLSAYFVWTALRSLAGFLQYVLPTLLALSAGIGAWITRRRRDLGDQVIRASSLEAIQALSPNEFEQLVGEAFRRQGYVVRETGLGGPDGGVDLELRRSNKMTLVQCKRWRSYRVGVNVVRELYGVVTPFSSRCVTLYSNTAMRSRNTFQSHFP